MQKRLDELLPKVALPAGPHTAGSLAACFQATPNASLSLEIGFGGGEHLAALAKTRPDTAFIGAEPFTNGIVSLLRHIDEQNLKNIRIWPDDVRLILGDLPEASLTTVYVMFPDPWPKTAMQIGDFQPYTLDKLAFCLKPGGCGLPATIPWQNLGCLQRLYVIPAFSWTAQSAKDWRLRPQDWPETRYMIKGVREGRSSSWFDFKRN